MADQFPILLSYRERETIAEARKAGECFLVISLPWSLIEPHEKQAQANHYQTLKRLAERGGLGAQEAIAVLENRPYRPMPLAVANQALVKRLQEHAANG